ncbi:MAG: rhamnulokinase family protein [Clostridia bacterium]
MKTYALAIDLGASGGRHMLGSVQEGKLVLEEVYRFSNGMIEKNGHLCWNTEELFAHILAGMKACAALGKLPSSVGVDTWGVDFVLLDKQGERIGDCVAYRDQRTQGMDARLEQVMSYEELYQKTGIAKQSYNTLYQLMAVPHEEMEQAERLLFMPDYFHYMLSGVAANEYTIASTSALLNAQARTWDAEVLKAAEIPMRLFDEKPKAPGTVLGNLRPEVAQEIGYDCRVILPASHDTGSAFMAVPARDEHAVYLSSGTWSLLGVESELPVTTRQSLLAGFTNEGGYGGKIRYLQNIMGMWILQSIRHELNDRYSFAEMAELALEGTSYQGTFDVTDNRFLAPKSMIDEIKAALTDAKQPLPQNTQELLCCVNQSLAKCYAAAVAKLQTLTGNRYTSLNIVGGGSQNQVLNAWTAKATHLPVYAGPSEGSALGNVMAQLIALGSLQDLKAARAMIDRSFPIAQIG